MNHSSTIIAAVALVAVICGALIVTDAGEASEGATLTASFSAGDDVTAYIYDDGSCVVSGTGAMTDYTTYSNSPFHDYASTITSVTIESGVTSVGAHAFDRCAAITEVTIGADVTYVGTYAFHYCYGITKIIFEGDEPTIKNLAFYFGGASNLVYANVWSSGWASDALTGNAIGTYTYLTFWTDLGYWSTTSANESTQTAVYSSINGVFPPFIAGGYYSTTTYVMVGCEFSISSTYLQGYYTLLHYINGYSAVGLTRSTSSYTDTTGYTAYNLTGTATSAGTIQITLYLYNPSLSSLSEYSWTIVVVDTDVTYVSRITSTGSTTVTVGQQIIRTYTAYPTDAEDTSLEFDWSYTGAQVTAMSNSSGGYSVYIYGICAGTFTLTATNPSSGVSISTTITVANTGTLSGSGTSSDPYSGTGVLYPTYSDADDDVEYVYVWEGSDITVSCTASDGYNILQWIAIGTSGSGLSIESNSTFPTYGGSQMNIVTGTLTYTSIGAIVLECTDYYGNYHHLHITVCAYVTSITISGNSSTTGSTITLTATTYPTTAKFRSVTWEVTSGTTRATISSTTTTSTGGTCTLTLSAVGSVTVTATATDGSGVTATKSFTVNNLFSLSYSANGGSGAPSAQSYTGAVTSYTFTLSSTKPTYDGFVFLGWSTSSSATTATYQAGETYTMTTTGVTNPSVTLYAVWLDSSSLVSDITLSATYRYIATGYTTTVTAVTSSSATDRTVSWSIGEGSDYAEITSTTTTSTGGTCTITMLGDGESDAIIQVIATSNDVGATSAYTYVYLRPTYTYVVYDANGGEDAPESEVYELTQSNLSLPDLTVTSDEPTLDGYTFAGWDYTAHSRTLSAGDVISVAYGGTATLYAIWTAGTGEVGQSHTFGVIYTEVFMQTYGSVIVNGTLDLNAYFSDYENLRVNFYSFAIYGTSMVINGVEIPVTDGKVTLDGTTYTLQNIYVTYEDGYVYLTFASESGSLTRATVVSLGEEENRTIEFNGAWYFTTGVWTGAVVEQQTIEMGWEWSFSGTQAILAFVGVMIVGIIIAYRYTEMTWLDWLVVVIGAIAAFTLVGLI